MVRCAAQQTGDSRIMAIIVTGATGAFGRAASQLLLQKVGPDDLILTTRKPEQLAEFAARGVRVRRADFDHPATLAKAFAGGTHMLLISILVQSQPTWPK